MSTPQIWAQTYVHYMTDFKWNAPKGIPNHLKLSWNYRTHCSAVICIKYAFPRIFSRFDWSSLPFVPPICLPIGFAAACQTKEGGCRDLQFLTTIRNKKKLIMTHLYENLWKFFHYHNYLRTKSEILDANRNSLLMHLLQTTKQREREQKEKKHTKYGTKSLWVI